MKRVNWKRVTALLLAAFLTFALSACAAAPDDDEQPGGGDTVSVKDFTDALTHMSGESNVRSEITMSVRFSANAKPVSLKQLISKAMSSAGDYTGKSMEDFLLGTELGLTLTLEVYEGTALLSLGWLGEGRKSEPVMTVIYTDEVVYISTEILQYIGDLELPEEAGTVLAMLDCEYIAVDLATLAEMMGSYMDFDLPSQDQAFDSEMTDAALKMLDSLSGLMGKLLPKLLTGDVLKGKNGSFTLSLNPASLLSLLKSALTAAAENETEITAVVREFCAMAGIDGSDLNFETYQKDIRELQDELKDADPAEIPDFDLTFGVDAKGTGTDKKQKLSVSFTMPAGEDLEMPFDLLALSAAVETSVATKRVAAPTGKTLSFEEIFQQLMMSAMVF